MAALNAAAWGTLVVYALVMLVVIRPVRISVPARVARRLGKDASWNLPLDLRSAPLIGVIILLATTAISGDVVRVGIVGSPTGVQPYDVLVLFISLVRLSAMLHVSDAAGLHLHGAGLDGGAQSLGLLDIATGGDTEELGGRQDGERSQALRLFLPVLLPRVGCDRQRSDHSQWDGFPRQSLTSSDTTADYLHRPVRLSRVLLNRNSFSIRLYARLWNHGFSRMDVRPVCDGQRRLGDSRIFQSDERAHLWGTSRFLANLLIPIRRSGSTFSRASPSTPRCPPSYLRS